ncbi:MAG: hypothetical protein NUV65_03425 [Candidatus Roizmanbacteria bacterium]|nr:hypothetical protein [Candidatus Roizmanbacteria bacterium]
MIPPEIFKYTGLISTPLFSLVALLLIKKTRGFTFSKSTISKSILLLEKSTHRAIFQLNFLVKAALDLGFLWYLMYCLQIPVISFLGLTLILSVFFFGLLAYFTEGKYRIPHLVLVYSYGSLWGIDQVLLALLTKDTLFIVCTSLISATSIVIAFWYLFMKKLNVFVQILCVSLLYFWQIVFILEYLK